MNSRTLETCAQWLTDAEAILIGAGAGLTAAAGISYTDKDAFAQYFPAWVRKGFSMQYQLMGYNGWSEAEKWGYYTVHLGYVYFGQNKNMLYEQLRNLIGEKDYFVMTSNVDELFHKNGFEKDRIYSPQGSYGRIQCTVPCSENSIWDIKPYFEPMKPTLHPEEQYITDSGCIPKCPRCGASMFINARVDDSFIETPYQIEREQMMEWLSHHEAKKLLFIELGAGYNTPVVIRFPMERLVVSFENSAFIRVNMEYANVPNEIKSRSISIKGDIKAFIDEIAIGIRVNR